MWTFKTLHEIQFGPFLPTKAGKMTIFETVETAVVLRSIVLLKSLVCVARINVCFLGLNYLVRSPHKIVHPDLYYSLATVLTAGNIRERIEGRIKWFPGAIFHRGLVTKYNYACVDSDLVESIFYHDSTVRICIKCCMVGRGQNKCSNIIYDF